MKGFCLSCAYYDENMPIDEQCHLSKFKSKADSCSFLNGLEWQAKSEKARIELAMLAAIGINKR